MGVKASPSSPAEYPFFTPLHFTSSNNSTSTNGPRNIIMDEYDEDDDPVVVGGGDVEDGRRIRMLRRKENNNAHHNNMSNDASLSSVMSPLAVEVGRTRGRNTSSSSSSLLLLLSFSSSLSSSITTTSSSSSSSIMLDLGSPSLPPPLTPSMDVFRTATPGLCVPEVKERTKKWWCWGRRGRGMKGEEEEQQQEQKQVGEKRKESAKGVKRRRGTSSAKNTESSVQNKRKKKKRSRDKEKEKEEEEDKEKKIKMGRNSSKSCESFFCPALGVEESKRVKTTPATITTTERATKEEKKTPDPAVKEEIDGGGEGEEKEERRPEDTLHKTKKKDETEQDEEGERENIRGRGRSRRSTRWWRTRHAILSFFFLLVVTVAVFFLLLLSMAMMISSSSFSGVWCSSSSCSSPLPFSPWALSRLPRDDDHVEGGGGTWLNDVFHKEKEHPHDADGGVDGCVGDNHVWRVGEGARRKMKAEELRRNHESKRCALCGTEGDFISPLLSSPSYFLPKSDGRGHTMLPLSLSSARSKKSNATTMKEGMRWEEERGAEKEKEEEEKREGGTPRRDSPSFSLFHSCSSCMNRTTRASRTAATHTPTPSTTRPTPGRSRSSTLSLGSSSNASWVMLQVTHLLSQRWCWPSSYFSRPPPPPPPHRCLSWLLVKHAVRQWWETIYMFLFAAHSFSSSSLPRNQ